MDDEALARQPAPDMTESSLSRVFQDAQVIGAQIEPARISATNGQTIAIQGMLLTTMRQIADKMAVFFAAAAELADDKHPRKIVTAQLGHVSPATLKKMDQARDKLYDIISRPGGAWIVYHLLGGQDSLELTEIVTDFFEQRILAPHYYPFVVKQLVPAIPSFFFVEDVGALIFLPQAQPSLDNKMALAVDFEPGSSLAQAFRRWALDLVDTISAGDDAPDERATAFPLMQTYDLDWPEDIGGWWKNIAANMHEATSLRTVQTEPPFTTLSLNELSEVLHLLSPLTREQARTLIGNLDRRLVPLADRWRGGVAEAPPLGGVREIFSKKAIESIARNAGTDARLSRRAMALQITLLAIIRTLREFPEHYAIGLSDDMNRDAMIVFQQDESGTQQPKRALIEYRRYKKRDESAAKLGVLFSDAGGVGATAARQMAIEHADLWSRIAPINRSELLENRRELISWLQAVVDDIDSSIQGQDEIKERVKALSKGGLILTTTPSSIEVGFNALGWMFRYHSPMWYAGAQPSGVFGDQKLTLARMEPFLKGMREEDRPRVEAIVAEAHEQTHDSFLAHQKADVLTREIWGRSETRRYIRGKLMTGDHSLPEKELLGHLIDILRRLKNDEHYEVRLTDNPPAHQIWLNDAPAMFLRRMMVDDREGWGELSDDPRDFARERRRYEALWHDAIVRDNEEVARFIIVEALDALRHRRDVAHFLDQAIQVAGKRRDAFVDDLKVAEERAEPTQERRIFFTSVPTPWLLAETLAERSGRTRGYYDQMHARADRFREALADQRAPIRLLSQRETFERWITSAPDSLRRLKLFTDFLGGYPVIEWRLTESQLPIMYEMLGDEIVFVERQPREDDPSEADPRIGWWSRERQVKEIFAGHFESEWKNARTPDESVEWIYLQIQQLASGKGAHPRPTS